MKAVPPRSCIRSILPLAIAACAGAASQPDFAPDWADGRARMLFHQTEEANPFFSTADHVTELTKRHMEPGFLLDILDLRPGMQVADIGAGIGWFTFRMARAVGPGGMVTATDIQEISIEILKGRVQRREINPFGNVRPLLCSPERTCLEADSVDLELMAHLDFYLRRPLSPESSSMLRDCFRALRPEGRLVVAQYMRPKDRLENLLANFEDAGFIESGRVRAGKSSMVVTFQKPPAERP